MGFIRSILAWNTDYVLVMWLVTGLGVNDVEYDLCNVKSLDALRWESVF